MTPRDRLAAALSPDLLNALEALISERVAEALGKFERVEEGDGWLTVSEAAGREGCSTDAIRMRAKRGRYATRYVGRSLYVQLGCATRPPGVQSGPS